MSSIKWVTEQQLEQIANKYELINYGKEEDFYQLGMKKGVNYYIEQLQMELTFHPFFWTVTAFHDQTEENSLPPWD